MFGCVRRRFFFPKGCFKGRIRLSKLNPTAQIASANHLEISAQILPSENYFIPVNKALPRNDEFYSRFVASALLRPPDQSSGDPSAGKQIVQARGSGSSA